MTHIILLDGKLWAFEPPEKPASPTIGQSVEYERAHYLALEQKIEIINPSEIGPFLLQENEPIKWEGTVEIKYVNSNDYLANAQKKVAVLIAPVKEEKLSDNEVIAGVERMLSESQNNVDSDQKKKGSENTLTPEEIADWDRPKSKPVPSEQEKQEEMWNAVGNLISMDNEVDLMLSDDSILMNCQPQADGDFYYKPFVRFIEQSEVKAWKYSKENIY